MSTNMEIANEIIRQLGGNAFARMTGARNFVAGERNVSFRIPGNLTRNRINAVRVTLDPSDTYTVNFTRIHGTKMTTVAEHSDIYAEDLPGLFREVTGLETRMPRVIFG